MAKKKTFQELQAEQGEGQIESIPAPRRSFISRFGMMLLVSIAAKTET